MLTKSICCVGTNSSCAWFAFRGAGAFRLMLSSASLLLILKSGCLNSHACISWLVYVAVGCDCLTYATSIRRCPALFIVMSNFVEVVFVQLPDKRREVTMFEMFRKNMFRELFVLLQKLEQRIAANGSTPTSRTTKLSPSLPHRTTLSSCGLSNILEALGQQLLNAAIGIARLLVQLADLCNGQQLHARYLWRPCANLRNR